MKIPPKVSVSDMMGVVKGRTAIRIFKSFPELKEKLYWENHFWANGYCVDTIGLDEEMIRKYVRYQEKRAVYRHSIPVKEKISKHFIQVNRAKR